MQILDPESLVPWLLGGDPAMRWQVMRDLFDAPADLVAVERARVETEGAGARLLAAQGADGNWCGAAFNGSGTATMHALTLLRELGLDPLSSAARRAIGLVQERVTWAGCAPRECHQNGFFQGETEPCVNGQVAAAGAYFGVDVRPLIDRLLAEQLADGGWNCEAERGSTRSSFNTTICVLEALLEYEGSVRPEPAVAAARRRGEEYLLERRLMRRLSTGEVITCDRKRGADWRLYSFPAWWHYDVLRGLDHLRAAGALPDRRAAEAVELVASKCDADGRWRLDVRHPGLVPDETEVAGAPSRWITLRALRVLKFS